MARPLYLLEDDLPWWPALAGLAAGSDPAAARAARAELIRALVHAGAPDVPAALADALLFGAARGWSVAAAAEGARAALTADVALVVDAARTADAAPLGAHDVPVGRLAPTETGPASEVRTAILDGASADELVARALAWRARHGGGPLGRFRALRWDGDGLSGVARPAEPTLDAMVDLSHQIRPLVRNTEAFLDGRPAMHALLYGPRGSGKSTVVRALLTRYADRGLRLVEVPADALSDLPRLLAVLDGRPERFLLFVDDLSFEAGDVRYHPLKSLLEGSVEARPDHVRLYATSNRRHLVQERLRDRPDPLDDDVHAWDTQNERLALADRFGLLVTFPSADRKRYLEIVRQLAERQGASAPDLNERADRFARAGNGYSGRTAQQFIDAVLSDLA